MLFEKHEEYYTKEIGVRKLMFFLIGLLAVFNLISAYASYNNDRYESVENSPSSEIVIDLENAKN